MVHPRPIVAAVLAGGLGTRLRSVVADRPKVLAPVRERPYLEYLLAQLVEAQVARIVLCTGYLGDQIEQEFGSSYGGVELSYSRETAPLGTGGALRLAAPLLDSDPVLVLNGDSYCRVDLRSFQDAHAAGGTAASIVVVRMPDASRFGLVSTSPTNRVLRFEEKTSSDQPGWINAGIYLLTQRVIRGIPTDRPISLEREVFPHLVASGIHAFRADGPFVDIGTPESYAMVAEVLTTGAPVMRHDTR